MDLRENNQAISTWFALWLNERMDLWCRPLELIAFETPCKNSNKRLNNLDFLKHAQYIFYRNTHRSTVTLHPDPGLAAETESAENRLAAIKKR